MGVCDTLTIEYEMEPGLPKDGWQTKDIDCNMSCFIVTKDGRLLEKVPKIEIQNGKPKQTSETKIIDRNYEGIFTVYNIIDGIWHEFEITMIDGNVKLIRKNKNST